MAEIYVVMWETWDGVECAGGDLYMTMEYTPAWSWMMGKADIDGYSSSEYLEEESMWFHGDKDCWDKLYIDVRPLDKEL